MNYGDKVFVISTGDVEIAEIRSVISYRGMVTGYHLRTPHCDSAPVKVSKKDVFTDEEEATKALFIRNLKKTEKSKQPAEDVRGDRHWITGHKRHR